jgi:hypothetical protein
VAVTLTAGTPFEATTSVTTGTVTLPAGLVNGDWTFLFCTLNAATGVITGPAGWSTAFASAQSTASTSHVTAIYYRKWVGGDTDPAVTCTSGRLAVLPVKVSGAHGTNPIEGAVDSTSQASATTAVDAPSQTSTLSKLLVTMHSGRSAAATTIILWAPDAAETELAEATSRAVGSTNASLEVCSQVITAGSTTGSRTATADSTATGSRGISMLLAAAAVTPFETTNWSTTTTPLTISVTGALTGDQIVVFYGGDNGTGSGACTAATASTTGGSTGAWTEPEEGLATDNQAWVSSSTAAVTADGTVTVSLSRTQSTGKLWGGMALLVRGHNGIGNHARSAPSAAETVSLTVSQDSAVGVIAIDWDALATVAFSPAGATDVERAIEGATEITVYAGYWLNQAAGTRGYGIGTSSTTNLHIIAIEVLAAAGGPPIYAMLRPAVVAP